MLKVKYLLIFILFLFYHNIAKATTYYIDTKHATSNDQNTGTFNSPWKTLNKANQTVIAGDTVLIKSGTYNTYISPQNSGTPGKMITYMNYNTDTVTITETTLGIDLNKKSYISVKGINFYKLDNFLWIQDSATYNIISYCNFDQGRTIGWSGSKIYRNSSYNWVHHCRFSKYGKYDGDDIGSILDIGNEESQTDFSKKNRIENNKMFFSGHHVLGIFGSYNIIRNNLMHNEAWSDGRGYRTVYVNGYSVNSGHNLIEGNRIGYFDIAPAYPASKGMQVSNSHNIIRNNMFFYNNLSGIQLSATNSYISDITDNMMYNNTFFNNGWNPPNGSFCPDAMCSAVGFALYSGSWIIKRNVLKNNIYFKHPQSHGFHYVDPKEQISIGNWSGDTLGDPKFVDTNKTPSGGQNTSLPNLRLQDKSPCIDAGTFLTTITSPSNTGTSFQVDNAGYFMDGWDIMGQEGDEIQLFQSTQKAHIAQINYSTKTITVDKNITWTKDQGICLAYEGKAPDIGAIENSSVTSVLQNQNLKSNSSVYNNKIYILNNRQILRSDHSNWRIYTVSGKQISTKMLSSSQTNHVKGIFIACDKNNKPTPILLLK